jgi:hypothetical protein
MFARAPAGEQVTCMTRVSCSIAAMNPSPSLTGDMRHRRASQNDCLATARGFHAADLTPRPHVAFTNPRVHHHPGPAGSPDCIPSGSDRGRSVVEAKKVACQTLRDRWVGII